ncbi:MAG: InlB B-repeat-containing protein [Methylococcales bacterium]
MSNRFLPTFGIFKNDGNFKAGMDIVFSIPGGPGKPGIEFDYIPPYGSTDAVLGKVLHVNPSKYKVAVYIKVSGGWWTKPTFASPLTNIAPNGNWATTYVTGGIDHLATEFAAFLVRNSYSPPLLGNSASLPPTLTENAVSYIQQQRPNSSYKLELSQGLGSPLKINPIGTLSSSPGGINCGHDCLESFDPATAITLNVIPNLRFSFLGWSGGPCDYTELSTCTFTMDSDHSIRAHFGYRFILNVNISGSGVVTVGNSSTGIRCAANCSQPFVHNPDDPNFSIPLKASPGKGYRFSHWSAENFATDCIGTQKQCNVIPAFFITNDSIVLPYDRNITANFVRMSR